MGGSLRPGRRLVGALLLASLLAPVVPAAAQTTDRDWALCENRASAFSPAEVIASCTAIIQSATETEPDLSIAYSNRAHAYAAQANHRRHWRTSTRPSGSIQARAARDIIVLSWSSRCRITQAPRPISTS